MSSTQMSKERAPQMPAPATVDTKLEVVVLPVADVDRAKSFYTVLFSSGLTTAVPGSVQGNFETPEEAVSAGVRNAESASR